MTLREYEDFVYEPASVNDDEPGHRLARQADEVTVWSTG